MKSTTTAAAATTITATKPNLGANNCYKACFLGQNHSLVTLLYVIVKK